MIEIQGLSKNFDGYQALDNMNLKAEKASIYGLIGVNGSGKTTLLKHITGVLKADSGSVKIDGQEVYDNIEIKERVGYIPDELYFFGNYNLPAMAEIYRGLYPNWDEERFKAMCEDFGLPVKNRISKFSKGMQKQAAFILVMSARPDYLILDEPIDGLDPIIRKKVWNYVVDDVAQREMTVLVSSHNLKEMEGICDYIGIISAGQMKIERDLDELKSDIHKLQVAFKDESASERVFKDLKVLHWEKSGSVEHLIIREKRETVEEAVLKENPLIFDLLPLSLEEVFIYEMGGENSDIHEILA